MRSVEGAFVDDLVGSGGGGSKAAIQKIFAEALARVDACSVWGKDFDVDVAEEDGAEREGIQVKSLASGRAKVPVVFATG